MSGSFLVFIDKLVSNHYLPSLKNVYVNSKNLSNINKDSSLFEYSYVEFKRIRKERRAPLISKENLDCNFLYYFR